jgi:thiol-disulfide isomerase/thioredoxin
VDTVVLAARLLLAAVFVVAAVGKLLDLQGARAALFGFGVPPRVASLAGPLVPLAELAAAVALVARPSAQWGGIAALALLLAFLGGIAYALARGRAPDCHCFGIFHSSRAGPSAIYRNAALAALAGFVVIEAPGPSLTAWVSDHGVAELLAIGFGAGAAILAAVAIRLWQRNKALQVALERVRDDLAAVPPGLPSGAVAPDFDLPVVGGGRLTLESLRDRGLPVLLVFMDPGCIPCRDLVPNLARWQATLAERLTIAVISSDGPEDNEHASHGMTDVGLQNRLEVSFAYRVRGAPSAAFISPSGRVASSLAQGPTAIEALIRLTLRRDERRSAVGNAVA